MDATQPLSAAQPTHFAGRYEIIRRIDTVVEVIDRQPWLRCWSCGTTANEVGELFCTSCGAALDDRHYRGQISKGEPTGLALIGTVLDPEAREILPELWDQVEDGDATLTLAADTGRAPVTPPLSDLDALYVGRGLARLLRGLHSEGLSLGALEPNDVELTAALRPRLRDTPELARMTQPEQIGQDLLSLAALLEALTATPRRTRRLEEDQAQENGDGVPVLEQTLRELRTGSLTDAAALETKIEELLTERTHPIALRTRVGAATDKGMVRELDEDSLFYTELRIARKAAPQTWNLYIVADGMGGHSAGEVASDLAIRGAYAVVQSAYLAPTIDGDLPDDEARLKDIVRQAVLRANEYVLREAQSRGNDMGTTLTLALTAGDRAIVGNIGDSRTYLYRDGALQRISKDHSLVQRLVDLGQIGPDDVYSHPQRNAVLRSLGDRAEIQVDVFSVRLKPGDALFLCSDGQWEMTRDPEMAAIIAANPDPQAACDALITAANKAGGEDNITCILVKFEAYS